MNKVKARLAQELDAWMRQQGDRGLATEKESLSRQAEGGADHSKNNAEPQQAC